MSACKWPGKRQQRGATLIEFALVLPVFLLLIFGILFYGIAFVTQQAVNYAAESGAEAAVAIDPNTDSDTFGTLAASRANARIRNILGYFRGVDQALPSDANVSPTNVEDAEDCPDGNTPAVLEICVISPNPPTGSRQIRVRLSPDFQQLLGGFPQPAFLPTLDLVQATGSATIAQPNGGNGGNGGA